MLRRLDFEPVPSVMVRRPTSRTATELVTWQRHLAERNPRAIPAQVAAVKLCRALTAAHCRSTEHRLIGTANLLRGVHGSRRGSARPLLVGEKSRRRARFVTVTICSLPAVWHLAGCADG